MFVGIRQRWRRMRKGVVAAATVAAVAACAIGVPLPAFVQKPQSDMRYPCEHHACGCVDAEACWRDCCCMTPAQKLAWAERAGVKPPAFVLAAAARQNPTDQSQGVANSCCSAKGKAPLAARSCCSKAAASSCCGQGAAKHATSAAPPAPRGIRLVMLHDAMKCRGLTVSVALLPPSLPVSSAEFLAPPLVRFVPLRGESLLYESPSHEVDYPPPDAARA